MRKRIAILVAALGVVSIWLQPQASQAKAHRPNVLFIIVDDLNTHLPPYGYMDVVTPNIEALAKEGVLFTQAHAQYPVCGPSRASFLTSLYPEQTMVLSNKGRSVKENRPDAPSLFKVFQDSGYWMANAGKVYHRPHTEDLEWDEAHNIIAKQTENELVKHLRWRFENEYGAIDTPEKAQAFNLIKEQYPSDESPGRALALPIGNDNQTNDDRVVEIFSGWLDTTPYGNEPFFIALGFHKPHVQFTAPQRFFDMYPLEEIKPEPVPFDDWLDKPEIAKWSRYKGFNDIYFGLNSMETRKRYMQGYYASVSYIDTLLGKIVNQLKAKALWDSTIVVFFSDHGYHIGNHFMYGKVTLFDEATKVPLIIRVPGSDKEGFVVEKPVELLDVFPTLTELAGIPNPESVVGTSLVPLLENPTASKFSKVALTIVGRNNELIGRSIRSDRYRYTQWGANRKLSELYDYKTDPREHNNLVSDERYADVLGEMRSTFLEKVTSAGAIDLGGVDHLLRATLGADTYRLYGEHIVRVDSDENIPITPRALEGHMAKFHIREENETASSWGWSADVQRGKPADEIIVFLDDRNIFSGRPNKNRPGVSERFNNDQLIRSGFTLTIPQSLFEEAKTVRFFGLSNGIASELQYGDGPSPQR
ncbi:MAG: sulfatase [Proteobacteria bacterium]|nr:sulfatase [Pseudomonadota bacterium]